MAAFSVDPWFWLILVALFSAGLVRRLWVQWRSRRSLDGHVSATRRGATE
jgi:hypothetical protein